MNTLLRCGKGGFVAASVLMIVAVALALWRADRYRAVPGAASLAAEHTQASAAQPEDLAGASATATPAAVKLESTDGAADSRRTADFERSDIPEGDLRLLEAVHDYLLPKSSATLSNDAATRAYLVLGSCGGRTEWAFRVFDFTGGKSRALCRGWVRHGDYSLLLVAEPQEEHDTASGKPREAVFRGTRPPLRPGVDEFIDFDCASDAIRQALSASGWVKEPAAFDFVWLHDSGVGERVAIRLTILHTQMQGSLSGGGDIDRESLDVRFSPYLEY